MIQRSIFNHVSHGLSDCVLDSSLTPASLTTGNTHRLTRSPDMYTALICRDAACVSFLPDNGFWHPAPGHREELREHSGLWQYERVR